MSFLLGGTRRQRRLRMSVALTALGVAVLGGGGLWLERSRDTDLQDPALGISLERRHQIPDNAPALRFEDVAPEVGIRMLHGPGARARLLTEDTGSGLAWGDYDGDGDPDLYLVNLAGEGETGWNRLFRNDAGHFVDVTAAAGVADSEGFGMGASFADFDDDGRLDLLVTNLGPNRLYRNLGDGRFEDVAEAIGVAGQDWSISASWGDYDRDGRLDFYLANYVDFDERLAGDALSDDPNWQGTPLSMNPNAFQAQVNRLFQQQADGTFKDVALMTLSNDFGGRSLGASFIDLDGDGWLDLYVANDVSPNALLHNLGASGEAVFEDRSWTSGTADPRGSMGLSVADLAFGEAPDGLPDLFITHWVAQENALYQGVRAADGFVEYRDRAQQVRLGQISTDEVGWGCAFVDLDLDGRLDLVVANGSTLEAEPGGPLAAQSGFMFWNDGQRFWDLAPAAGEAVAEPRVARGLAVADYDGDGDIDLAISVNRGAPVLLRNDSVLGHHWISLDLAVPESSRRGARVSLEDRSGNTQTRWFGSDASFASGHALELHFGLGESAEPVDVEVRWNDGTTTRYSDLAVDRRVTLTLDGSAD